MNSDDHDLLTALTDGEYKRKLLRLRILNKSDTTWELNQTADCAFVGNLNLLKWMRSRNPPFAWNHMVCCSAASNNDLNFLRWARSQNPPCEWNSYDILKHAASNGQFEIFEYALQNGAIWDCALWDKYATQNILSWARQGKLGWVCQEFRNELEKEIKYSESQLKEINLTNDNLKDIELYQLKVWYERIGDEIERREDDSRNES